MTNLYEYKLIRFAFLCSLLLSFSAIQAAEGTIFAFPQYIVINANENSKTTVRWRAEDASAAEVRVSMDGNTETVFAAGDQGAQDAPWIQVNHAYVFRLYAGPGNSELLAQTVVMGMDANDTFDQYAPLRTRRGGLMVTDTAQPVSQWATNPTSDFTTDVFWGEPQDWQQANAEEWAVKLNCGTAHDFVWVNAYRDAQGNRFAIGTTKALLITDDGEEIDITQQGACSAEGQPYALYHVRNKPYVMKVWGDLYDVSGIPARRFYWEHKITPYQWIINSCWANDAQKTRIAIRQDEAWWDSDSGWTIGHGNIDTQTNEPDGAGVFYARYQTVARNTGYGWTYQRWDSGAELTACLQHAWDW
jgi:hypothetical protein